MSTRLLSGYGSLSILVVGNLTHTHSFIGFDDLGIPGTKNTIAKGSIFLGTNSNSAIFWGGDILFGRFWVEIRMPEPNTPA